MPPRISSNLNRRGSLTFDEQLWPIYVSIVVFGAYLLGVVLAFLRFDDTRLVYNAATWLTAVTLLIGFSLWGVGVLQNRYLRRTLLLSLILSLLVNVMFLSIMARTSIFRTLSPPQDPLAARPPETPRVVIPEYAISPSREHEMPRQEFERPVETGLPEEVERVEIARQEQSAAARPVTDVPTPEPQRAVSSVRRESLDLPSAPRIAERQALLSRQLASSSVAARDNLAEEPTDPLGGVPVLNRHSTVRPGRHLPATISEPAVVEEIDASSVSAQPAPATPQATAAEVSRLASSAPVADSPATADTEAAASAILPGPRVTSSLARATVAADDPTTPELRRTEALSPERTPVAVARANRPASSIAADLPAGRTESQPADAILPDAEPSRLPLSQSAQGTFAAGEAANLNRGLPAPEVATSIASSSARRVREGQELDVGPAISPSIPAVARQLRSTEIMPPTNLPAADVPQPQVTGAPSLAAIEAAASAAIQRQLANAPSARLTAPQEAEEIDLGPLTIAADLGTGRVDGGGPPEIVTGDRPRALTRRESAAGPAAPSPVATGLPRATLADTQTDVAALTPGDQSLRAERGDPLAASGTTTRRAADRGLPRALANADVAALANEVPNRGTGPRTAPSRTRADDERAAAMLSGLPTAATVLSAAGSSRIVPRRSPTATRSPAQLVAEVKLPPDARRATDDPAHTPSDAHPAARADSADSLADAGSVTRQAQRSVTPREEAALIVNVDAEEAAGGIGPRPSVDLGTLTRQSQAESANLVAQPERFVRRNVGGAQLQTDTSVIAPVEAYRQRLNRRGQQPAGARGRPSPKTEEAIELGLVYLVKSQASDGSWSLRTRPDWMPEDELAAEIDSDVAATGLSLLAFLGAGYHHKEDLYQETVREGLDFLLGNQNEKGDLYVDLDPNSTRSAWMYSHAIATLALCEAYGMTQDPQLRRPAQQALDFIVASQHPQRGGWRYAPGYGTDTSVTGWMMMTLKSGQLAGLTVDERAFQMIDAWLDIARGSAEKPYLFRYNPFAPDTEEQRHGWRPTRTMSAVGLLMRLYGGWSRNDPQVRQGAEVLLQYKPEMGSSTRPRRDTYYWYYATQVMFHMGGRYWEEWNKKLHPLLVETQVQQGPLAGSWHPTSPVPDRWANFGGRLYVTTMNLLSLEVYYRHLPLYDETGK